LPQLPQFATIIFEKCIDVEFDMDFQNIVPIILVVRWNLKHMPLKMAWTLTIHKSHGMTLQRAIVDIGDKEGGFDIYNYIKSEIH